MPPSGSPTVRRRRLAAELRRLRGNRTGTEVSRAIGWSPTKISRAESGRESLPPPEVEKLLDYYSVTDPLRDQLLGLAEDATQRGWWEDYAGALAPEYVEYIGLEAEAASIADWQPDVIPGLLQTEAYTRQISIGYQSVITTTSPSVVEQMVRVRMRRQERLTREPVLHLSSVIDEAVLLRRMGGSEVMRAQLDHLITTSELPNVEVRILPLDREVPLIATSFSVLSFGPWTAGVARLGDVVNIEGLKGQQYIEGEDDTYMFRLFFQALTRAALPPDQSRRLLLETQQRVWGSSC
jgi:hypothetical protein